MIWCAVRLSSNVLVTHSLVIEFEPQHHQSYDDLRQVGYA